MKQATYLFLSLVLLLSSCVKNVTPVPPRVHSLDTIPAFIGEDGNCIERTWELVRPMNFPMSVTDSMTAINILRSNNISYNSLRLVSVIYDTFNAVGKMVKVRALQYVNHVGFFTGFIEYNFKDGKLFSVKGYDSVSCSLDTIPSLTLPNVRWLFEQNTSAVQHFSGNDCLQAQFGYYDLNAGNGSDTPVKMVKAWRVHYKDEQFPVIYFRDDGALILNKGEFVFFEGTPVTL